MQFLLWCLLIFLDEAMQQHHDVLFRSEENTCDFVFKADASFSQVRFHFSHKGHTERPAELHRLDFLTYGHTFVDREEVCIQS